MKYVLIVILISLAAFLTYRERFVFFLKNEKLIKALEKIHSMHSFDNIWCSFGKIVGAGEFYKVYLLENCVVLIDDYDLDSNRNRKKYAETYLFQFPNKIPEIDKKLFRHMFLIESIESNNESIKIIGQKHDNTVFGFTKKSYKLTVNINVPLDKESLDKYVL